MLIASVLLVLSCAKTRWDNRDAYSAVTTNVMEFLRPKPSTTVPGTGSWHVDAGIIMTRHGINDLSDSSWTDNYHR